MEQEVWRDIIITKNGVVYDYTGLYQVSNLGRVRSLKYRGKNIVKELKQGKRKDSGYMFVHLGKDTLGKNTYFLVHRLVATMFIPNPNNLPVVNHLDENPGNNCVDNLEWCTQQQNINHGTRTQRQAKTQSESIKGHKPTNSSKVICIETGQVFGTIKEAQEWLGKGNISSCCRGVAKTAGKHPITKQPLHWMYYKDYLKQMEDDAQ